METDIISEGFKMSIKQHGLIYEYLIADGDCNVYNRILLDDPYEEYGITVKKIECTNHLLRNMAHSLKNVGKGRRKLSKWRKIVENNILRIRTAITKAIAYRSNEDVSEEEKISRLRDDIFNLPYHIFGSHANCASYFCKGTKEDEVNFVEEMEKIGILSEVEESLSRISSNCSSLLQQLNNNIVERCNSVLAKMVSGKRINWSLRGSYECRCYVSVTQSNSENALSQVAIALGKNPTSLTIKLETQRRSKNVYNKINYQMTKLFNEKNYQKESTIKVEKKEKFYGNTCEKPDLNNEEYKAKYNLILSKLLDRQKRREEIEIQTRKQSDCTEWFEIKKLLLTASHFKSVCSRRNSTPCASLVKTILFPSKKFNKAMTYGIAMERKAKEAYEKMKNITVTECGLFIDEEIPYLGATPDGLIEKDGVLEIKCPFVARNMTIDEGIKLKKGFLNNIIDTNTNNLKKQHKFYYQIQGQLHITKRQYCDLFIWTPLDTKCLRISKDEQFWNTKMLPYLTKFYTECLLPEIIDSRIKRQMPVREPKSTLEAISKERTQKKRKLEIDELAKNKKRKSSMQSHDVDSNAILTNSVALENERYENGLFKNYLYYMRNVTPPFTVGQYTCNEVESFCGFKSKILWSEDCYTLREDEWISGAVIDSFMISNWKQTWQFHNVTFIPSEMTNFIVGDRWDMTKDKAWFMYNINWHFTGLVFLPYCLSHHWCLIVLDTEKKIFYHIDPIKKYDTIIEETNNLIFERFKKYLSDCSNYKTHNLCNIEWEQKDFSEQRPLQNDSVNCGAYIMFYMHYLSQGMQLPLTFDPIQYRIDIANNLLSYSDSVQDVCLACMNKSDKISNFRTACVKCYRWVHNRCLIHRKKVNEEEYHTFSIINDNVCIYCT